MSWLKSTSYLTERKYRYSAMDILFFIQSASIIALSIAGVAGQQRSCSYGMSSFAYKQMRNPACLLYANR